MQQPQIIKDLSGRDQFVVIPYSVYERLRERIDAEYGAQRQSVAVSSAMEDDEQLGTMPFRNPVTLMRQRAGLKQKELAEALGITQAYVSKMENAETVSPRFLGKVRAALQRRAIEKART
jgi:DNA-binding Xre family transcriptional regulator